MATTIVDKNLQNYYNKSIEVDKDIQKTFAFSMGDLKFLTNYDAIVQSVRNILNTRKGELVGLNDFGCSIYDFLFEQLTAGNVEALRSTLISEVQRFENRIEVVDFMYELNNPIGTLKLDMVFRVKALGANEFFREQFLLSNSSDSR
jgi:phage baseplate assembly protein W